MSIMLDRALLQCVLLMLTLLPVYSYGEEKSEFDAKSHSMIIDLKSGLSYNYLSFIDNIDEFPMHNAVRIFWKPDRKLRIGLESGLFSISSKSKSEIETEFGKTHFSSSLNGVPILLIFNMNFNNFELSASTGAVVLMSEIEAFEKTSKIIDYDNLFSFSLSYFLPISDYVALGLDAQGYYIPQIKTSVFSIGIILRVEPFGDGSRKK